MGERRDYCKERQRRSISFDERRTESIRQSARILTVIFENQVFIILWDALQVINNQVGESTQCSCVNKASKRISEYEVLHCPGRRNDLLRAIPYCRVHPEGAFAASLVGV